MTHHQTRTATSTRGTPGADADAGSIPEGTSLTLDQALAKYEAADALTTEEDPYNDRFRSTIEFPALLLHVLKVISGDEEAQLSFHGARSVLDLPGQVLVVDIGGGSTEFVVGDAVVSSARSVDIGCVRMTERHLRDDPPSREQIRAATADIDAAVATAAATTHFEQADHFIGVAGSVTTVAALAMGLPEYDSQRIHGARISAVDVRAVTSRMLRATRAQRAAEPVMHPGRVDVIGGGALVLDRIMAAGGFAEVIVSEHDILDGMVLDLAQ